MYLQQEAELLGTLRDEQKLSAQYKAERDRYLELLDQTRVELEALQKEHYTCKHCATLSYKVLHDKVHTHKRLEIFCAVI